MRRLHNEVLDAVCDSTVKRLLHVVNLLIVARLHVVDDNLSGERAADRPIRVSFLQSVLNALDILYATVVEGRTEADNEQLVFADFVFVARVVFRGVARIAGRRYRLPQAPSAHRSARPKLLLLLCILHRYCHCAPAHRLRR